jgi:hypothetical protein
MVSFSCLAMQPLFSLSRKMEDEEELGDSGVGDVIAEDERDEAGEEDREEPVTKRGEDKRLKRWSTHENASVMGGEEGVGLASSRGRGGTMFSCPVVAFV